MALLRSADGGSPPTPRLGGAPRPGWPAGSGSSSSSGSSASMSSALWASPPPAAHPHHRAWPRRSSPVPRLPPLCFGGEETGCQTRSWCLRPGLQHCPRNPEDGTLKCHHAYRLGQTKAALAPPLLPRWRLRCWLRLVPVLPYGRHPGRQLVLQLVDGCLPNGQLFALGQLSQYCPSVALKVATDEEVGLMAEGAGHPLPAQMVAGRIAIQQVLQEPVGSGTSAPVASARTDVSTCGHGGAASRSLPVDRGSHPCRPAQCSLPIDRQLPGIGQAVITRFERFLIVMDAIPQIEPHPLPEVPPAEVDDRLSALIEVADPCKKRIAHLHEGQHAMTDVGR